MSTDVCLRSPGSEHQQRRSWFDSQDGPLLFGYLNQVALSNIRGSETQQKKIYYFWFSLMFQLISKNKNNERAHS